MPREPRKVWLVLESGWEYSTPVRAFTDKAEARATMERLNESEAKAFHKWFNMVQIDLVIHDGANVIRKEIRNGTL